MRYLYYFLFWYQYKLYLFFKKQSKILYTNSDYWYKKVLKKDIK